MIFLVHYDRVSSRLVSLKEFFDSEREACTRERMELELSLLANGLHQEVVLLEANSEDELRKTHRRYFESLDEIRRPETPVSSSGRKKG